MKLRLAAAVLVSTLMAGLAPASAQIPPQITPKVKIGKAKMVVR